MTKRGSSGGLARAKKLSPQKRGEIARGAALARWRKKPTISKLQASEFCTRHRLTAFYLFGSVLRRDFGPKSDIDIMVDYESPPSLSEYLTMKSELETIFGRNVDLVTKKGVEWSMSKIRREEILKTAKAVHVS